ncbi:hypothetical protein C2845_PM07G39660 [Panicum miliaceum]|uniref:Cytochrome P450 71A1-like n=1 Tax=Panicum miliaceum TaxID=4540 RepID=A0A3L6SKS7_PANMI|nr:hypothetical protein C2845_PM07G39660 [Panicum miliaceum]
MKTRDLAFASSSSLRMADRLYYGTRDMVFAPYGERWRQLRRVCVSHLLTHTQRRVLRFRAAREQETAALLDRVRVRGAGGAVVNLAYANAVVSRATFGDAGYGLDGGGDGGGAKLRKVFGEFEELLGTVPMAEMVPWLRLVDVVTGLERKARRTSEEIDRLLERVIADHRRRRGERRVGDGEDDGRDFVDVLLDLSEAEDEVGGVQLDTVTIKATILDMLAAGTDTSYTLLEWAMAELINHPTQMRKLQDEGRRRRWRRHRGRPPQATVPQGRHQGDALAAPAGTSPSPPGNPRGHRAARLSRPGADARCDQRMGDRPGPGHLGARRGVRAGEVCRGQQGGVPQDGGGFQVLAVRRREEGMPGRRVRRASQRAGAGELAVSFRLGGCSSRWREAMDGGIIVGRHERGERPLRAPQEGPASGSQALVWLTC